MFGGLQSVGSFIQQLSREERVTLMETRDESVEEEVTVTQAPNEAIEVRSISKTFVSERGEETTALKDATFDIEKGKITVFVGPSGCGKTTMLRVLGGLEEPTSGSVDSHISNGGRGSIGFAFQDATLMPWRTAAQNVGLSLELSKYPKSQRDERIQEMLELVRLPDVGSRRPYHLSGGMRHRVAIARALAHDPELLLMDEPFAALDAQTRDEMNLELQRIWSLTKKTIIFVTHSVPEAVTLADRVVLFATNPGRVYSVTDVPFDRPRGGATARTREFAEMVADLREQLRVVQQR